MNPVKKFIHSAASIFQGEIEEENAKLAKIEKARNDREARLAIINRAAAHRDAIKAANANAAVKAGEVDKLANYPTESIYHDFVSGLISVEQFGERLAQREAVVRHASEIKKRIHKFFVESAEQKLAEFEKQNASALKGINLVEAEEPQFIPAPPENCDERLPLTPSPGVRMMLGLRPGELVKPAYEPTNGDGTIHDLDPD
jgi:hypothetical protein